MKRLTFPFFKKKQKQNTALPRLFFITLEHFVPPSTKAESLAGFLQPLKLAASTLCFSGEQIFFFPRKPRQIPCSREQFSSEVRHVTDLIT